MSISLLSLTDLELPKKTELIMRNNQMSWSGLTINFILVHTSIYQKSNTVLALFWVITDKLCEKKRRQLFLALSLHCIVVLFCVPT